MIFHKKKKKNVHDLCVRSTLQRARNLSPRISIFPDRKGGRASPVMSREPRKATWACVPNVMWSGYLSSPSYLGTPTTSMPHACSSVKKVNPHVDKPVSNLARHPRTPRAPLEQSIECPPASPASTGSTHDSRKKTLQKKRQFELDATSCR